MCEDIIAKSFPKLMRHNTDPRIWENAKKDKYKIKTKPCTYTYYIQAAKNKRQNPKNSKKKKIGTKIRIIASFFLETIKARR